MQTGKKLKGAVPRHDPQIMIVPAPGMPAVPIKTHEVWIQFAGATVSNGNYNPELSAEFADAMLNEFRARFEFRPGESYAQQVPQQPSYTPMQSPASQAYGGQGSPVHNANRPPIAMGGMIPAVQQGLGPQAQPGQLGQGQGTKQVGTGQPSMPPPIVLPLRSDVAEDKQCMCPAGSLPLNSNPPVCARCNMLAVQGLPPPPEKKEQAK